MCVVALCSVTGGWPHVSIQHSVPASLVLSATMGGKVEQYVSWLVAALRYTTGGSYWCYPGDSACTAAGDARAASFAKPCT